MNIFAVKTINKELRREAYYFKTECEMAHLNNFVYDENS